MEFFKSNVLGQLIVALVIAVGGFLLLKLEKVSIIHLLGRIEITSGGTASASPSTTSAVTTVLNQHDLCWLSSVEIQSQDGYTESSNSSCAVTRSPINEDRDSTWQLTATRRSGDHATHAVCGATCADFKSPF